jgi:hypothetical protein
MIVKIKNSEVFKLPVNGVAMGISNEAIKQDFDDGVTPWDVIDRSVNEFDRLTEENKRLREALMGLVETSDINECQLSQELLEFHQESTELTKAKQLLSELSGDK